MFLVVFVLFIRKYCNMRCYYFRSLREQGKEKDRYKLDIMTLLLTHKE